MQKQKIQKSKLISEFSKNASEIIKIQLTEYNGKQLLDIRVWVRRDEGEYIATRKGISLRVEQIGDLKHGIDKAMKEANDSEKRGKTKA